MIRSRVIVSGRVQGVFFRSTCRRMAAEHGVTGWVRNLPDGTVEAVFEGPPDAVRGLVDWARHGPGGAEVSQVDRWEETPAGLVGFRIRD